MPQTLDAVLREQPDANFFRMDRDVASSHHERIDGKGYPSGLKGESIPLCGRIVAVADIYEALVSNRVYKKAFDHHVARGIILNEAGSHLDPDITEAFLQCELQFTEIKQRNYDVSMSAA